MTYQVACVGIRLKLHGVVKKCFIPICLENVHSFMTFCKNILLTQIVFLVYFFLAFNPYLGNAFLKWSSRLKKLEANSSNLLFSVSTLILYNSTKGFLWIMLTV